VNWRSAPWARAFTSTAPVRSTIQALACRQLLPPKNTVIFMVVVKEYANQLTFASYENEILYCE